MCVKRKRSYTHRAHPSPPPNHHPSHFLIIIVTSIPDEYSSVFFLITRPTQLYTTFLRFFFFLFPSLSLISKKFVLYPQFLYILKTDFGIPSKLSLYSVHCSCSTKHNNIIFFLCLFSPLRFVLFMSKVKIPFNM